MNKVRFVASYSGGKDSVLAIAAAMELGLEPACLLTTYDPEAERSFFHGIPEEMLREAAKAMALPLRLVPTSGAQYERNFERALDQCRQQGMEAVVFGDIDIQEHRRWCSQRCERTGLQAVFPLWNQPRRELAHRFIDRGFQAVITTVNTDLLPPHFLGRTLTRALVQEIVDCGADGCGENGEYHTFAFDGPIFHQPVPYQLGDVVTRPPYQMLPIAAR